MVVIDTETETIRLESMYYQVTKVYYAVPSSLFCYIAKKAINLSNKVKFVPSNNLLLVVRMETIWIESIRIIKVLGQSTYICIH